MCLVFLLSACGTDAAVSEDTRSDPGEDVSDPEIVGDGGAESGAKGEEGEYLAVYYWNNADVDAKPRSGRIADDWNCDGEEDVLTIETKELEGSEIIKKLELSISGSSAPYVISEEDCYFIDIIPGNFDSDEEMEILLLFDMRYAGGNGTIGIQLLDFNGSEYVNAADGFFTGCEYSVDVRAGANGSYLISRTDGKEMSIAQSDIAESAIGMVTGAYFLEVLEKDNIYYFRLRQYVAGEDMTDHVGDVVSMFGVSDGRLLLLEEKVAFPNAGTVR